MPSYIRALLLEKADYKVINFRQLKGWECKCRLLKNISRIITLYFS